MNDSEKQKIFEASFKKANEGELYKFDEWLKNNGMNPVLFNQDRIFRFFWRHPDRMIGNEECIATVGEYIGLFLKDMGKPYHIPIIGGDGSGKTLLLRILEDFTNKIMGNLGRRFTIDQLNHARDINVKITISQSEVDSIRFIDDCGKIEEFEKALQNIINTRYNAVFITAWTPEEWLEFSEIDEDLLPITEKFVLFPFKADIKYLNFIKSILEAIMLQQRLDNEERYPSLLFPGFDSDKIFQNLIIHRFYDYTNGFPLLTIKLLLKSIEYTFLTKKENVDVEIIDSVAKKMKLYDIKDKMEEVSTQHLRILLKISSKRGKKGTRPVDLVKEFDLDKSTIAYHLKELRKKELIEVNRIGKSSFYQISKNLIPFVQQKIIEEMIEEE